MRVAEPVASLVSQRDVSLKCYDDINNTYTYIVYIHPHISIYTPTYIDPHIYLYTYIDPHIYIYIQPHI